MKIGKSTTTTVIRRLPEFSQIDQAAEKKMDNIFADYGLTFYPTTAEVIAPIDTEIDYEEWENILNEIREAIATE